MTYPTLAALLAVSLLGSTAHAAATTHFDITVQAEGAETEIVRVDLEPKGTVRKAVGSALFIDISAPEEDNGTGRSVLKLLARQTDGSFKIVHIAGLATFTDEAVQASYGMCGGKVVYRSDLAPGAAICP